MFRRIASAVVKDLKRVFTPGTIVCIVLYCDRYCDRFFRAP